MSDRQRYSTGDPALDQRLVELLDAAGATKDVDQLFEILVSVVKLAGDQADRLNLKITNGAVREMREAFRLFAPYRNVPKVTIFGSARTRPDDPLYLQTRDLAGALAAAGWIIVTGAGPGIMSAGVEGAGPENSLGVNIRLPFEQPNRAFDSDQRLVTMKYFFTRKLMLMKESAGFAVLPGGFGTLDEVFELLTLLQTGKAAPAPIVLLEVPGGTYWRTWERFVREELVAAGLVSTDDLELVRTTDDVGEATAEILGFFRNYHSMRYVGPRLVIRLRGAPTKAELADLNERFADICTRGRIESTPPQPPEISSHDHLELPRIALHFNRANHGRLRLLIDALNALPSAPALAAPDADSAAAAGSPPEVDGATEGD
ncbi:MAG: TIGR00730 family Rossman fold protein [Actinomycetota bacterium]|nr:TIGR00730 family Rossman fold protein [Actinomycetota bacterium]